ncbi:MAG: alpha/beta hydrolase [Anaerolineae bacterium]|nr:alpha/beta hydrolase [Anaerolineae bacterium]NUQ05149.1 alpha/beta hydrolase [Anaerolineae bacterium]
MSAITTDSGDIIHYQILGRGRPVVLVHTWIGSWRYWTPVMTLLNTKFRVYAVDLFGYGDSARNPVKYTLEHQIALLEDFMNKLGITRAAMIGHGLGALIVTEFCRRHPDVVPRMMLISPPLFDPGDLANRVPAGRAVMASRPLAVPSPAEITPSAPTVPSASSAMRAALLAAARAKGGLAPELEQIAAASVTPPPAQNPLRSLLGGQTPESLLARCFRRAEDAPSAIAVDTPRIDGRALTLSVDTYDAGPVLDTLRLLSTLILLAHGVDDPLIPVPNEDVLHYITVDKDNTLVPLLLPNVRHFPMLEDERFGRIIGEFLENPDIGSIAPRDRWRRRNR